MKPRTAGKKIYLYLIQGLNIPEIWDKYQLGGISVVLQRYDLPPERGANLGRFKKYRDEFDRDATITVINDWIENKQKGFDSLDRWLNDNRKKLESNHRVNENKINREVVQNPSSAECQVIPDRKSALYSENSNKVLKRVQILNFKQFKDNTFTIKDGVTVLAGANNSGKSTLLHALVVWEYCKQIVLSEKGSDFLYRKTSKGGGVGVNVEDFVPLNVPDARHLWTNLRANYSRSEAKGNKNKLNINVTWDFMGARRYLFFSLSLVNNRIFITVSDTNVEDMGDILHVGYIPTFAGIQAKEERVLKPKRDRLIAEGLVGAVLRNVINDMYNSNMEKRNSLKRGKTKLSDEDLADFRETDPWEILIHTIKKTFGRKLYIPKRDPNFNLYIDVFIDDQEASKKNRKDIMVEGTGFLQWLSVFSFAVDSSIDVLLLDEPDAHLHPDLQLKLINELKRVTNNNNSQVILATHSPEILKYEDPSNVLVINHPIKEISNKKGYLKGDFEKDMFLSNLGSPHSSKTQEIVNKKRIIFHEGSSDRSLIEKSAELLKLDVSEWAFIQGTDSHKERKKLWAYLAGDIHDLIAVSIRDRDGGDIGEIEDDSLKLKGNICVKQSQVNNNGTFYALNWRRRNIESYLVSPSLISISSGRFTENQVVEELSSKHALRIDEETFQAMNPPAGLLNTDFKQILYKDFRMNAGDLIKNLQLKHLCDDVKWLIRFLETIQRCSS